MAKSISMTDDEILELVQPDIERARAHQTELSVERQESYDLYRFQPLGNERDGFSKVVDSLAWNSVESLKPNLHAIFTGDFFSLTSDNEARAKKFKDYLRYVLFRKQNGKRILKDWIHDSLINHFGIIKCCYREDYDLETKTFPQLTAQQFEAMNADPNIKISKYTEVMVPAPQQPMPFMDPATGQMVQPEMATEVKAYEEVKAVRKVVTFAGPSVEVIPAWEFFYVPGYSEISECPFVAHRVRKTLDDIRKGERSGKYRKGVYDLVKDKVANRTSDPSTMGEIQKMFEVDGLTSPGNLSPSKNYDSDSIREGSNEVDVWECYFLADLDKDGLLEPTIVSICEDVVLQDPVENPYGGPPFILGYCNREPHKIEGFPLPLQLRHEQLEQTNLRRIMVDSAGCFTYPTAVTNDKNMARQWSDRALGDIIVGNPDGIREIAAGAPSQFILRAMEAGNVSVEKKTGITSYNQGLDANSLNKMLCIHTPVPLADGEYIQLGEVESGDRIIGSDGLPVTVLAAHEIHNPERAYRIVFASGEEIFAGGEHLWTVQTESDKFQGKNRTIDTDTLYARKNKFAENIYIPRVQRPEIENPETPPIDPYILGVWLGDGHSWSPRVTTMDGYIVARLTEWASANGCEVSPSKNQNAGKATTYYIKGSPFYSKMRSLNLLRRGREDDYSVVGKHIPETYFHASYADRLELLRGLMDTDGCHHSGSLCVFSQKDGRLLGDVTRLIESLGGWWNESTVDAGPLAKEGQRYVNITFHIFDNPFSLPVKADKWRAPIRNTTTQPIVSVEPVSIRPMRCLTVDSSDGLFCVGRKFTVTHNTATGISMIMTASQMRQKYTAMGFADSLEELIRQMIAITQMFPPQDVVRLLGSPIEVTADDLQGKFDIEIDVGTGPQEKQATAQQLDQHIQFLTQVGIPMGIATPVHLAETIYKKYDTLDINAKNLLLPIEDIGQKFANQPTPTQTQQMQQQMQQMDAHIKQSEQQIQQMQAELKRATDAANTLKQQNDDLKRNVQLDNAEFQMKAQLSQEEFSLKVQEVQAQIELAREKLKAEMELKTAMEAAKIQLEAAKIQADQNAAQTPPAEPKESSPQVIVVPSPGGQRQISLNRVNGQIVGASIVEV